MMFSREPVATLETWWYSGPATSSPPEHVAPLTRSQLIQNMSVLGSAKSNMS